MHNQQYLIPTVLPDQLNNEFLKRLIAQGDHLVIYLVRPGLFSRETQV